MTAIKRIITVNRELLDRTNADGTCLYCGRRLQASYYKPHRGTYGDNAFCGKSCGYAFGVALAAQGQRLKPYKGAA